MGIVPLSRPGNIRPCQELRPAMANEDAKKRVDCADIAMDGLIVLILQIMASDGGDEDADSDGGRPEKRIWWNRPMLVVMLKGLM